MEMITSAFVPELLKRLGTLVEEEVVLLLGVKEELNGLEIELNTIREVLADAEGRKLNDSAIQNWLGALRDVSYDADDIIDECRIKSEKQHRLMSMQRNGLVHCYKSFVSYFHEIKYRHRIGRKIKNINDRVSKISRERVKLQLIPTMTTTQEDETLQRMRSRRQTSPVVEESDIVGLDEDAEMLVKFLTEENERRIMISAVTGMGGIGKTTLAQKVYNYNKIKMHFHPKMWIYVSENFKGVGLLKEIIRSAGGTCNESESKAELDIKIQDVLRQKKFLIVLDDVWTSEVWEVFLRAPLQSGAMGSRILVTTRKDEVARRMGATYIHHARFLSPIQGWTMLCQKVFSDMEGEEIQQELRDVGMRIVEKCEGLPLAIKVVAGVLASKSERKIRDWKKVLDSYAWNSSLLPSEIYPALYLSYEDLPSALKQCFLYLSFFLKDSIIGSSVLSWFFIAEGFVGSEGESTLEDIKDDYFEELVSRNLLQIAQETPIGEKSYKMHDALQDLARYIVGQGHFYGDVRPLDTISVQTRRLSFKRMGLLAIPSAIVKLKGLRTLVLSRNEQLECVPEGILSKLGHLRVLDLSFTGIERLPHSVRKLIHLRCLLLRNTRLRELPESLCVLQKLQTLDIRDCPYLYRLPEALSSLCSLRHLHIRRSKVEYMPNGIGKLASLQTLRSFLVGCRNDIEGDQCRCNVNELQELFQLRDIGISRLERVPRKAEAEEANLRNKSNLRELELECFFNLDCGEFEFTENQIRKIEEVYEALSPPPSLERLVVTCFFGTKLPSWISEPSLTHLDSLVMEGASLVEQLPPLGQLPKLRVLCIRSTLVRTIGPGFFGGARAFSMLKVLKLVGMVDLEGWERLEEGAMPSLVCLKLYYCPKLRSLPEGLQRLTTFQRLEIRGCMSLREIKSLTSITYLQVKSCPMLVAISNLTALDEMYIHNCPRLKDLGELTVVKIVEFLNFGGIWTELPEWLCHMNALEELFLNMDDDLLTRCLVDGEEWPKIKHVSRVQLVSPSSAIVHTHTPNGLVTKVGEDALHKLITDVENGLNELQQKWAAMSEQADLWKSRRSNARTGY